MISFEKLGAFYLGRPYDPATSRAAESPLLYDSRDLTTHALVVGMTGSGKTGLSIVVLEEAALDGIPAIVVDPKGDMANLALQFPDLHPDEFTPWIEPDGGAPEDRAREVAALWERGLQDWGQSKSRVRALSEAAEIAIYTPGAAAGRPISVLRGFAVPSKELLQDQDAFSERVANAVSGLLGLAGLEADPLSSREHVLLSNLLEHFWRASEDASLERLIEGVQSPPFERLGALEVETFFPSRERLALAARLNGLLASPSFAAWREGEPLDVQRLLTTPEGKPRVSVLSIGHLSDAERMFFVTLLLNEVLVWMRSQEGTGSLRALLAMDEIFGFFPPVQSPPSKPPMLALLKQARAFGLGILLATQNPVDLDYRGLANIGTWFLGRLQTARDRERLLAGLESAAGGFDRRKTEELLSSLDKRVFLMHDVHEDAPVLFQTRWAMSYLRGPLTLEQLKKLSGESRVSGDAPSERRPRASAASESPGRPSLSAEIEECFLSPEAAAGILYRPALLASARLHYASARDGIDFEEPIHWLVPIEEIAGEPEWRKGGEIAAPKVDAEPLPGAAFHSLPSAAAEPKSYGRWRGSLQDFLRRERALSLLRCGSLRMISRPGESEPDFRARLLHRLRENRDRELDKLRKKHAPELARVEARIRRAEERLARESSQYQSRKMESAIDFGMTLAGALFGRKLGSVATAGRASRAARSVSRARRERDDVERAEEELRSQKERLAELESELEREIEALGERSPGELEPVTLKARKSDVRIERLVLAWNPEPA